MKWSDVRSAYPEQWLVIEALEAHSTAQQRILDRIAVIETCMDGKAAFESYRRLHKEYPLREFYYVSTSREMLDIRERAWLGIRRGYENPVRSCARISAFILQEERNPTHDTYPHPSTICRQMAQR